VIGRIEKRDLTPSTVSSIVLFTVTSAARSSQANSHNEIGEMAIPTERLALLQKATS